MNAMQVMQKGVPLSPATIQMHEHGFRLVAVNSCNASKHLLVGCLLQYAGSIMYHTVGKGVMKNRLNWGCIN